MTGIDRVWTLFKYRIFESQQSLHTYLLPQQGALQFFGETWIVKKVEGSATLEYNQYQNRRVARAGAARSRPFWLVPESFFWSGSYSYSYSTVNNLLLRDYGLQTTDTDYDYGKV